MPAEVQIPKCWDEKTWLQLKNRSREGKNKPPSVGENQDEIGKPQVEEGKLGRYKKT